MEEAVKNKIMDVLEEVEDPELGVDIVNLGLVYDVDMDEANNVSITMTLTSIGCPLAGEIVEDVKKKLTPLEEINDVDVNITFNPPWSKERMSRLAKIALNVVD